ncbi:MAG: beta-ketoacyl-ACP synthase III [Pirellulaceae bacterium]|nr:3-oxoacyl-ACP synthase [Planctomycetaceae bacterium]MDB4863944.1 ketoacyl-ACP synthase III [Pirellulaceae bacterium]
MSDHHVQSEADTGNQDRIVVASKSRQVNSLTGVQILASGCYTPENVIANEALAELGYDADWIIQRTGIQSRCRASDDQACSDLAYEAARRCLENGKIDASEIDLILLATITPDQPTPSTACHVQRMLGSNAPAMDLGAACSGFMYALVTGMQFIKTGTYQRVLIIGADLMSRTVNPADTKTFPLFGDGAGAVVIGPGGEEQGFISYTLGADGHGAELLEQPAGGTRCPATVETIAKNLQYLQMDGRSVFKWAIRTLSDSVNQVLDAASLPADEIDLTIFHQANIRIIDAAANDLGLPADKVFVNLDQYGNTSAASIPLALAEAVEQRLVRPGQNLLISGFGAGLAWGAGVWRW